MPELAAEDSDRRVWSPFGPIALDAPPASNAALAALNTTVALVSEDAPLDEARGPNSTHSGRSLPILQYAREMCNLSVILKHFRESDVIVRRGPA